MRRHRLLWAALVIAWGCRITVEPDRPLEISLTAVQSSAAVSEVIDFEVSASGPILLGIVVSYGDGGVDSVATMGGVSATASLSHAFAMAGTYVVVAMVSDVRAGNAADSVSIEVQ